MRSLVLCLVAACGAILMGGCQTTTEGDPASTAAEGTGKHYLCRVQIEGVIAGGAIKLNGSPISNFPGWVTIEVDEAGKPFRQYVVSLSTNIMGADMGEFVIPQGGEVPAKIFYERTGPVATGTAVVQGRN